jgi:hypothetical protein
MGFGHRPEVPEHCKMVSSKIVAARPQPPGRRVFRPAGA